jgi:hypothetical protein
LRAAELFFRPQRLTLHEGSLIAADDETIAGANAAGPSAAGPSAAARPLSPLVSLLGIPAAAIDVLSDHNADSYWGRSDCFDLAIDLTAGRRGLAALAEAMSRWVRHLLAVDVSIEPLVEMRDVAFTWYVGLDAEGTHIGNALWNGNALDEQARASVVGLYRLTFADAGDVGATIADEPVYLILAMSPEKVLRMKPQNLLTGLPVRHPEVVS